MLKVLHNAWHSPTLGPILLIVCGVPVLLIAFILYIGVPIAVLFAIGKVLVTGSMAQVKSLSLAAVMASALLWVATIAVAFAERRTGGGTLRASATLTVPFTATFPPSTAELSPDPAADASRVAEGIRAQVTAQLPDGVVSSDVIEEDYGAGFWLTRDKDTFWLAIGEIGPDESQLASPEASARLDPDLPYAPSGAPPTQDFAVYFAYDPGLDLVRRTIHRPDAALHETLWNKITLALANLGRVQSDPRPT